MWKYIYIYIYKPNKNKERERTIENLCNLAKLTIY